MTDWFNEYVKEQQEKNILKAENERLHAAVNTSPCSCAENCQENGICPLFLAQKKSGVERPDLTGKASAKDAEIKRLRDALEEISRLTWYDEMLGPRIARAALASADAPQQKESE